MSKKNKKVYTTINHIEYFLIGASAVIGCISVPAFVSLLGIPIKITSSAILLNIFAITAETKKYKLVIKKKKEKHNEILLLPKTN